MKSTLLSEFKEIDALVRAARGLEAQRKLIALHKKKLSLDTLTPFARLCTRAGRPDLALKVLYPIVRPTGRLLRPVSPEDQAEYGLALLRIGAISEGKDLLKRKELKDVPEALMYLGICYLREWAYSKACPLFRSYLASPHLTPYQRAIGKGNLAISLILDESHFPEVETLLKEAIAEAKGNHYHLLHAMCIREMGVLEMLRSRTREAQTYFEEAQKLLLQFGSNELHYANKWLALLELKQNPMSTGSIGRVNKVREEATFLRNWESVRNIDYHKALYQKDRKLIEYLYFGTPYEDFRKRLRAQFPEARFAQTYNWSIGPSDATPAPVLIDDSFVLDSKASLKVGGSLYRLYRCLTSDFYRPHSVASLFEKIFPGEHYVPSSSKYRVHQCIKNLRKWFIKNSLPLSLVNEEESYKLQAKRPCIIEVRRSDLSPDAKSSKLDLLRLKLTGEFTSKDVCKILKIEITWAQTLIKNAIEAGDIERLGIGKKTRYRFTSYERRRVPRKAA